MELRYLILAAFAYLLVIAMLTQPNRTKDKPREEFERWEESELEKATFAGGCFWGMEQKFEGLAGVKEAISGYTGGTVEDPSYEQVSKGNTGHYEAVRVYFDPEEVDYRRLLTAFWQHIDPTDAGGQGADRGSQYRTAIFYHNGEQQQAEKSKRELQNSGHYEQEIVAEIKPIKNFYPAESYHQNYLTDKKDSGSCGCSSCQGNNSCQDLSPLQYRVTQKGATETAFDNEYWNHSKEGIYVDIVSGEPLFSSQAKFKSGTGWPSFYQPLEEDNIVTRKEKGGRVEVRSKQGNSHLGHVFNDGPQPTGKRYCINSAALEFISKDKLEEKGYGKYLSLFD